MIRLYLIRHGETQWNKMRRLQGQADIPLNEFGRHLAVETAKGLREIPFAAAYTSPLLRAAETARLVLNRELPLHEDRRLMEMGFGIYEGRCVSDTGWDVPDPCFRCFFDDPEHYIPPQGAESFSEVVERAASFLQELCLCDAYHDKNVLISTHGAVLCGILNIVMKGKSLSHYWDGKVHKNCAVSIVEANKGKFRIIEENKVYYQDEVQQW